MMGLGHLSFKSLISFIIFFSLQRLDLSMLRAVQQQQQQSVTLDYTGWCRGNCQSCFQPSLPDSVIYITSFHANWYHKYMETKFENTILESYLPDNLIVYSEDEMENVPIEENSLCHVSLKKVFPWLEDLLIDPDSGLNAYYSENEFVDPFWTGKRVKKKEVKFCNITCISFM